MQTTLTVRLSEKETASLQTLCEMTGKSRSEVVRDALRTSILREKLDAVRALAVPRAQDAGLLTDEDVFSDPS